MHTFAFGSEETGRWGVGWLAGSHPPAGRLLVAAEGGSHTVPVELDDAAPDGEWRIHGDGVDLTLAPLGVPQSVGQGANEIPAVECLAHVTGQLTRDARPERIDAPGARAAIAGLIDADWTVLQHVAAWFAEDYGLVLTALHPRNAQSHAEARVTAAVLGGEGRVAEDPRLSTTYQPEGQPQRAGLELWLPSNEEDDELYPVRASGQAIGPEMRSEQDGISLQALAFRWFGRERSGPGVYLLARR